MSNEQAFETFIGLGVLAFAIVVFIAYIMIKNNNERYESLSNEQRADAREREERLQSTLDHTVENMGKITEAIQQVNHSVERQSRETNVAIAQLGNTVTTLTTTVDGLSRAVGHINQKVIEQERRDMQGASTSDREKRS